MRTATHLCFILSLLFTSHAMAAGLNANDEVILFPTSAEYNPADKTWQAPVHGWVFDPDTDSLWRKLTIKGMGKLFGLDDDEDLEKNRVFASRARMFLVDNQRDKTLQVRIAGQTSQCNVSEPNGHFTASIKLTTAQLSSKNPPRWLSIELVSAESDQRSIRGEIQLLREQGLSIITDVDDTIKISNVLDKKELLRNTFVREFEAVPGMSSLYYEWYRQGADFHYISASPWQLYPALSTFLEHAGFPRGSFAMKQFRIKDDSVQNLFASAYEYKLPIISELLRRYPQRKFILVGDSGEKDPEVYSEILRRFPAQVQHIYIRNVTDEPFLSQRYLEVLKGLDEDKLTVFDDARELYRIKLQ